MDFEPLGWYDFGFGLVDASAAVVCRGIGEVRLGKDPRAGYRTGRSREFLNVIPEMPREFV